MNRVVIIGNLTKPPEHGATQSGVSRARFTVAVQRRFRNQDGQREADFIPVVAWRQAADFCARYLTTGSKVAVEGSLQTRSYEAQDGSKRYVTEIIADNVESISSRQDRPADRAEPAEAKPEDFVEVDDDDQLPF